MPEKPKTYNKEKLMITGCNGFIGKNIYRLLKDKYEVHGIDRFVLADPMALQLALTTVNPDYIIHLSAYGNHSTQDDEFEMITANIIKTHLLLQVSKEIPYKAFLNISSSSVYGTKELPMAETDTLDTDTFYGATKLSSEYLARAFAKKYGKPIVNVRPFSIFGEGEGENRLIPRIIHCALTGEKLKLDPNAVHDWTYINDFVSGLEVVMGNVDVLVGKSVNIGTGEQHSNSEVLKKVEWILDKSVKDLELTGSQREFDTKKSWVADNTFLKSLGWSPEFNLMKGLRKTCNGYGKEHRS